MNCDGVLLLGGAGFIGSALAKRLEQEKKVVHILGRHDGARLEHVLPQCGTVVHLASSTTPGSSAAHPSLELGNLGLTLRLLELMQGHPKIQLIFFSSGGTVYGNPDRLPVTEDTPIAPLSNYGASKTIYRLGRGIDVRSVVLDSSRLSARLDWQPSVVLEDGVARTWEWLQQA